MAFNLANTRCKFFYTCAQNANDRAKLASLADSPGGDIKIAADHAVAAALGNILPEAEGGYIETTLHLVEYLIMSLIIFDSDLDLHAPNWNIKLTWLSALWAAMINAGMDSGRLETVELLRERVQHGMTLVSEAERTLALPNAIVKPVAEDTWWAHISPRR